MRLLTTVGGSIVGLCVGSLGAGAIIESRYSKKKAGPDLVPIGIIVVGALLGGALGYRRSA